MAGQGNIFQIRDGVRLGSGRGNIFQIRDGVRLGAGQGNIWLQGCLFILNIWESVKAHFSILYASCSLLADG